MYVLTEINCPEPRRRVLLHRPAGRLPVPAQRQRPAHDRQRPDVRPRDRDPGHARERGRRHRRSRRRDLHHPDAGIVFIAGANTAYRTTDAGGSWTPEPDVGRGNVQRLRAIDGTKFYAFGPNTLLRSTDAGQTWRRSRRARHHDHRHQLRHARPVPADHRPRRPAAADENGATPSRRSPPRPPRCTRPGFANPARAVAAGAGGATAVSNDGGRNYAPVGGDIAGSFQFGLRLGPAPNIALALGARGQLARTTDSGVTWKAINVATSSDLRDTSFSTPDDGYALDVRGGLFRTVNGGASWQPIDPGTTAATAAVITKGTWCCWPARAASAARPAAARSTTSRVARRSDRFDRAGSTIFAYGGDGDRALHRRGRKWTTRQGAEQAQARRPRDDVRQGGLRARHRRQGVAHQQRASAGPSCPRSAPTTGSRSRSAVANSG